MKRRQSHQYTEYLQCKTRDLYKYVLTLVLVLSTLLSIHLFTQSAWYWSLVIVSVYSGWLLKQVTSTVSSESVLVLPLVGVQTTTQYLTGQRDIYFIDIANIDAVVINEGLSMFQASSYLALLIYSDSTLTQKIHPLFPETKPTLSDIQSVFNDLGGHLNKVPDQ